ncbi:MAG: protein-export chaperone SecB [Oscillospiraceae bacterium]|jgi:preprotein translocase subunit SecB|nr:protein-export chaperone SecB [Oscillospiraceae bacterium]
MLTVQSKYASHLKLIRLAFTNIKFIRSEQPITCRELNIGIKRNISKENNSSAKVTLQAQIYAEDKSLELEITMIGFFELDAPEHLDQKLIDTIFEKNTLSIMFPYLRSQISLISTQPGMPPIIIPPININNLVDDKET